MSRRPGKNILQAIQENSLDPSLSVCWAVLEMARRDLYEDDLRLAVDGLAFILENGFAYQDALFPGYDLSSFLGCVPEDLDRVT